MITLATLTTFATHHWDGPPWPAFFIGPLFLLTALVFVALSVRGRPRGPARIVAERYARGDIDEDEYRRRLNELRSR